MSALRWLMPKPPDTAAHDAEIMRLMSLVADHGANTHPVHSTAEIATLNAHIALANAARADYAASRLTFATWALVAGTAVLALVTIVAAVTN